MLRRALTTIAFTIASFTSLAIPCALATTEALPRYPELQANVDFWRDVFSKHTSRHLVFHDPVIADLVWTVHDVGHILDSNRSDHQKSRDLRAYSDRYATSLGKTLERLASSPPQNDEEKRIAQLLEQHAGKLPSRSVLAKRVRVQRGLGDKLCDSYRRAVRYLPRMRAILAANGVPEELAYLPLVESGYHVGAHSKVGAVGVWQFMRATGRRYLHVDGVVDERRDPILATEAAAKYLRSNYDLLGEWPLAITAYNHGENGMSFAVRKLGTRHLPTIIEKHESKYFGFASKNFYAEFLAANDAMKIAETRCPTGGIALFERDSVEIDAYVSFNQLAATARLDADALAELNPALTSDVVRGRLRVPKGYKLFLPVGSSSTFRDAYASLPSPVRASSQSTYDGIHQVRAGETLSEIAGRYRVSMTTLQRINGLKDPRRLRVGQRLKVPAAGAESATAGSSGSSGSRSSASATRPASVRLAKGQTLSHVASRYGVSVEDLAQYNDVSDARSVRAGQLLKIPSTSGSAGQSQATAQAKAEAEYRSHRVGKGQTLSDIAQLYRTSVSTLQRHNRIEDPSKLRYGQVIRVPM
jgi:membrane-bound lytic murein transglycosylase D